MTELIAEGFPLADVRGRAVLGTSSVFPPAECFGTAVFGQVAPESDALDRMRLVPPVFTPHRMAMLAELGREPTYQDVDLTTRVGGFAAPLPVYVSALGSTSVASGLAVEVARQAGTCGIPLVIGENLASAEDYQTKLVPRLAAYTAAQRTAGCGGVIVQQSTEDADLELWNRVYSDPNVAGLLGDGRLGFELKVGQGAKPGIGGMTVLEAGGAAALRGRFVVDSAPARHDLRSATPGTFTEEVLRAQICLMRNNFPRARTWVKLPPARDIGAAARIAWDCGADAVVVDGAEAGTGWAPLAFLQHVGLPLAECLTRVEPDLGCLLVSGRMWQGARAVKSLALGASAVGLGRAALAAVDAAPEDGLTNLLSCMELEMRMLISALGKYHPAQLSAEDVWPGDA